MRGGENQRSHEDDWMINLKSIMKENKSERRCARKTRLLLGPELGGPERRTAWTRVERKRGMGRREERDEDMMDDVFGHHS